METKEIKEISFEDLVNEATKIGDKRNKVFNALIEKIASTYIPSLAKILEDYDLGKTFFRLKNRPRSNFDKHYDLNGNPYYGLCISYDGEIRDSRMDETETLEWKVCSDTNWYDKKSYRLFRGAAIELAEAIKSRIMELNQAYALKNECAENLINEK